MVRTSKPAASDSRNRIGRHRFLLLIGGPVVVALAAIAFYMTGGRYVSTDDAYVQAARVDVSADIAGRVSDVNVRDNQLVHAGQTLLVLDSRSFRIAVEGAQAQLAEARRRIPVLVATYRQCQADEAGAEDTLAYRQREYRRQSGLTTAGIASRAQLDQAQHDLDSARQALAAAEERTESASADLGGDPSVPVDSQPSVRQAQAALDRANLNLSYTVIAAPVDGVVTQVERLQRGDYINAAQPLFALVSQSDIWVEANFKETDLTHMRPNQRASIWVDAYPGTVFIGTVESVSPGTGSSFSLLPPENASGNWVKVVQRLPVRLSIDQRDPSLPLAAGMSVTATVDTRYHRSLDFWN